MPTSESEFIQLSSWEELITFIEKAYEGIFKDDPKPAPKPKRKKKGPPQKEELF